MKKQKRESDLICMWSGVETAGDKCIDGQEHIFPESIGGKDQLPAGDVSKEWNNRLSWLDDRLKREHPAMKLAYQKDPSIKGKKKSNKRVKQRRKEEKTLIRGVDGKSPVKTDQETGNTTFTNACYNFDDDFSRAIHKCVANVICSEHGSKYVRRNFPELIDFVKNGIDPHDWSYAVSFANPFQNLFCEPKCIKLGYFSVTGLKKNLLVVICFIHTSGIWIAAAKPNYINKRIIEGFSNGIFKDTQLVKQVQDQGHDFKKLYGMKWVDGREYIGQMKFLWVKKQIRGKPNPDDSFYLLTKCKLCGQINPTGIMVPKDIVLGGEQVPMAASVNSRLFDLCPQNIEYEGKGKSMRFVRMPKNSWNRYSISDLRRKGFNIDQWRKETIQQYIDTQGIEMQQERDIRNWNIRNCTCQCINCWNMVTYSAGDCFL